MRWLHVQGMDEAMSPRTGLFLMYGTVQRVGSSNARKWLAEVQFVVTFRGRWYRLGYRRLLKKRFEWASGDIA